MTTKKPKAKKGFEQLFDYAGVPDVNYYIDIQISCHPMRKGLKGANEMMNNLRYILMERVEGSRSFLKKKKVEVNFFVKPV